MIKIGDRHGVIHNVTWIVTNFIRGKILTILFSTQNQNRVVSNDPLR